MSEFNISIPGGEYRRLKTGGKYCPADILVTAEGSSEADLDAAYEAGRKAEYDKFWDACQNNGNRTYYSGGFDGRTFTSQNFYPKYDITPIEAYTIFSNWNTNAHTMSLKERMEDCGVKFDFSKTTDFNRIFYYNRFTEFPEMDMSNATLLDRTFAYNYNMVSIEKLIVGAETVFNGTFEASTALVDLTIGGTIGKNGFNVSHCKNLTHDSLMSIINALKDYSGSGQTYTITLGATNLAKLTDTEKAIATNRGWSLV